MFNGPEAQQLVQPSVHAARCDHGVPVHHSECAGGAGQLPGAGDAGGQGRCLSAAEPVQLLPVGIRCDFLRLRLVRQRSGYRLDVLHALQHDDRHFGDAGDIRCVHAGFSSIFTGLNFIVTINTMRPPGMTWFRMPLFLWATYSTSIIQVLATPVLGITLLLLIAERTMHIGIFDPEFNGDPVTFQHFFWFYSHPAVYIMILPAFGIISDLISVHSHKRIFGYRFIAYSSIAIALLGFLVWGHHMFTAGMSPLTTIIFSALTFTVSVPSAIKVFNWLATMYKGSISLTTPMCYAISFIFLFTIGGLTGLALGNACDRHASS